MNIPHVFLKLILLSKINTELNSKLTAEIKKFKACEAGYKPVKMILAELGP